jgi:hypothetical protein
MVSYSTTEQATRIESQAAIALAVYVAYLSFISSSPNKAVKALPLPLFL